VREVWSVLAADEACDLAMRAPGAGRVAADEVMMIGPIADDIRRAVAKVDPDALIRDASEGWAEIPVDGDDACHVVARLSELDLPSTGFVQGDVARVGVRVFVWRADSISLFVPAYWEAFLRRRVDEESVRT
jgi:hypothetical protein